MADEWQAAAETGNVQMLKTLFKMGTLDQKALKVQAACVAAANQGQAEAVEAFLDWGVPITCQDKEGKRLFHACIRKGLASPVEKLIEKRADPAQLDIDGSVPVHLAVKNKHLPVVKALLRGGVTVPPGLEMPGLAAVVTEVQIEKGTEELRKLADVEVEMADIKKAEEEVSKQMAEQLRLLKLKEDAKAAKVLVELERQRALEEQAAREAQQAEAAVLDKQENLKMQMQAAELDHSKHVKDFNQVQAELEDAKAADAQMVTEIAEKKKEFLQEKAKLDEIEKARAEREAHAKEVQAELKELQNLVEAEKKKNAGLEEQLKAAEADLRGWQADRKKAAELTAQAHKLLGLKA
eukprot:TRINITY_DN106233_c0_g1_i1.p1 TRINITY_DN106233_c0_g1~~TRINITY_DN106233_c0_g1_i1.p1  ORF type:complete len:368 (-),score=131.07 TRINITY_DN106233_c0_g1_i1:58-1113(-)